MRRVLAAALATLSLVAVPAATASAACPRASLPDIESQVMCLVCGVPLGLADSPQASRERDFINGLIDRCESAAQIKAALVAQYGPRVLALPRDSGFDAAAYIVPLLTVLIGVVVAVVAVRWWTAGRHAPPEPEPQVRPSAADARRLEAEIAAFER